ncbi:MAG TPA: methylmalonyl Co-A mutase-associated GTPase MeaB [Bryobacteraceae bacterium]|nr:methylmalonyl Co-A mutase-associated GTPase MeaB [Bryobacteraceae bacterium]
MAPAGTLLWARQIREGDLRALARAATAVENRAPASVDLLKELFPHTGKAAVIGITGAPGSGKSTLAGEFARVCRAASQRVGILGIDPSSPFSGGAILGDRIRMQEHCADAGVFIRSMATRGWLGGLARSATEMCLLLDAAGFDVILVETVGVGQAEVDIARLAAVTVLVLMPGMGDDVQAIKAGIMEIADVFVINKSDQPGADRLELEIRANLSLAARPDGWMPPIVHTVASEGKGVAEALEQVRRFLETRGQDERRETEVWSMRLRQMVRERLLEFCPVEQLESAAGEVAARRVDPFTAVSQLLQRVKNG